MPSLKALRVVSVLFLLTLQSDGLQTPSPLMPIDTYADKPCISPPPLVIVADMPEYSTYYVQPGSVVLLEVKEQFGYYLKYRVGADAPLGESVELAALKTVVDTDFAEASCAATDDGVDDRAGCPRRSFFGIRLIVVDMPWLSTYLASSGAVDRVSAALLEPVFVSGYALHPRETLKGLEKALEVISLKVKATRDQEQEIVLLNTVAKFLGDPARLAWILRQKTDSVAQLSSHQLDCAFIKLFLFPRVGNFRISLHVHQVSHHGRTVCDSNEFHDHVDGGFVSHVVKGNFVQTIYKMEAGQPPAQPSSALRHVEAGCDPPGGENYYLAPEDSANHNFGHLWPCTGNPGPFYFRSLPCNTTRAGESYALPAYWFHRTGQPSTRKVKKPAVTLWVELPKRHPYRLLSKSKCSQPNPPVDKQRIVKVLDQTAAYIVGERNDVESFDDILYGT